LNESLLKGCVGVKHEESNSRRPRKKASLKTSTGNNNKKQAGLDEG
jgi:hypothetical protein